MEIFTMRLPKVAIKELNVIAQAAYIPPRTFIRTWIAELQEVEQMNENPAVGAELPGTAPTADAQHTPTGGMVANGIES